jgi:hypothetical protein
MSDGGVARVLALRARAAARAGGQHDDRRVYLRGSS